ASPIIRAAAVALVRFGFRIALLRASAPVLAGRTESGRPTAEASGRANRGPRTVTPRKQASAPAPVTRTGAPPNKPASISPARATVRAPATSRRRVEKADGAGTASRKAWIGATLVARQAGGTAAIRVIPMPAARAAITPAGGITSPVIGSDSPKLDSS